VSAKKILFICGGLEPGRNGVGDYTRVLAYDLADMGWQVRILAINDYAIATPCADGRGPESNPCELRLPSSLSWKKRGQLTAEWLADFKPDVASLQYVPFSFHHKGLPFDLGVWLGTYIKVPRWHLMFHETWVGYTRTSPLKHRWWGRVQRWIALRLVRRLQPVMHTSNKLYQELLADSGLKADRLPLCSNVPISANEVPWMHEQLRTLGVEPERLDSWLVAGMFGGCPAAFPLADAIRQLQIEAEATGKNLVVLGMGSGSGGGERWVQAVQAAAPKAVVVHFGRQSVERVSAFMQVLDAGIATTPKQFLGKSGVAAAMQAHGVQQRFFIDANIPEYSNRWGKEMRIDDIFWSRQHVARHLEATLVSDQ